MSRFLDDAEMEAQVKQSSGIQLRREDPSTLRAAHIFGSPVKFPGVFQAFKGDPYAKKFPFQTAKPPKSPQFGSSRPGTSPNASPRLKGRSGGVPSPLLSAQISTFVTVEPEPEPLTLLSEEKGQETQ